MTLLFINAAPFVLAALLAFPSFWRGLPRMAQTLFTSGTMLLLFIILAGYVDDLHRGVIITESHRWMPELGLSLDYYLDGLALLFALVVTGVGAAIFWYSGFYFEEVEEQRRFTLLLLLFAGAMLGLVLAGNLFNLFVMWELTSITSFLLIGFKGDKESGARRGALQALMVTGGGGVALLAGLVLMAAAAGQMAGVEGGFLPNFGDLLQSDGLIEHPWYRGFTALIFLGAFTKSAQFPFHFWLPGSMSAPTPASAYLHSATMVKAGVYLLARFYPILGDGSSFWLDTLLFIGLSTMFIGAIFAIFNRDLKGLLAYSTISQLGALVALLALPDAAGLKAAYVGIIAHALYKSVLFLSVGSVDHATGTRIIDRLGGLARLMPDTAAVATISALSMAGLPPLMGFLAKETLLAALLDAAPNSDLVLGVAFLSAALTGTAAYMLLWDVFFRPAPAGLHFHAMPPLHILGPGLLAAGTLLLGFLLEPVLLPLLEAAVPKAFELHLLPDHLSTEVYLSAGAIALGLALFFIRGPLLHLPRFPLMGSQIYAGAIALLEAAGDLVLKTQTGRLRFYLASILGVQALFLLLSGLVADLARHEDLLPPLDSLSNVDALKVILLGLSIAGAMASVVLRQHLLAVLALGLMGYSVAGIFLLEPAPDVALVQFLVETLATVVLIIILGRMDLRQRQLISTYDRDINWRTLRDVLIAVGVGFSVFVFALIALNNRGARESISQWHLDNAESEIGVTDVVAAIVTDFRGMDTLIEIAVFSVAILGVLGLIAINYEEERNDASTSSRNTQEISVFRRERAIYPLATPLTKAATNFIFPVALLLAGVHILYGAGAPGDGFTAGVIASLGVALVYVVYGYEETISRLGWFHPIRFTSFGLLLAFVNGALPLLLGEAFMGFVKFTDFAPAGLKFATTLLFEIGIAMTVFGAVGLLLAALAHPADAARLEQSDMLYLDEEAAPPPPSFLGERGGP